MYKKHIRILSPSGAVDTAYIDMASARLREWGFCVSEGQHARSKAGRFAGTDQERLADLHEALRDPSVDWILCSRGGYGLQRIIDQVGEITKPVIGFSDITCLHLLAARQGVPSLHAMMCKHIATANEEDGSPIDYFKKALGVGMPSDTIVYNVEPHALNRMGIAEGRLIGGNLSVLYGLQGTPYGLGAILPALEKKPLLFIEDIAERHYHIDRMMNNLRLSGIFEYVGGVIVGQFSDCEDDISMGCTVLQTIRHALEGYDFPVIFDFPAGHTDTNMPLWLGTDARIAVSPVASQVSIRTIAFP